MAYFGDLCEELVKFCADAVVLAIALHSILKSPTILGASTNTLQRQLLRHHLINLDQVATGIVKDGDS